MSKYCISIEESNIIANDVLLHCYGESGFNQDMINRVSAIISKSFQKIMNKTTNSEKTNNEKGIIDEDELRLVFEEMHKGRDLKRHGFRGTYSKPQIAALWNQHIKTTRIIEKILCDRLQKNN